MKNDIITLISAPTVEGGSRKARNWLTNLYTALEKGQLEFTQDNNEVVLNGQPLNLAVAIVQSLEPVGNGGFSEEKLQDFLSLHKAGQASTLALSVAKKTGKADFVKTPKSVLSAEQYRRSRIRESLASLVKDEGFIEELVSMTEWDPSNEELEGKLWLSDFLGRIFPADAREVYEISLERERRRAQKWNALYKAGFYNVKLLEDSSMSAEIAFVDAKEGYMVLEREGYKVLEKVPDIENELFKLTFMEVKLPSQETDETSI